VNALLFVKIAPILIHALRVSMGITWLMENAINLISVQLVTEMMTILVVCNAQLIVRIVILLVVRSVWRAIS
jgi:hypothetical protein